MMSMKFIGSIGLKGGTGKTLTAVNVALELAKKYKVAILDVDIESSCVPSMLGLRTEMIMDEQRRFIPVRWQKGGLDIGVVSMGLFGGTEPLSFYKKGEENRQIISDFIKYTDWGDTEIVIVDFPAGTDEKTQAALEITKDDLLGLVMVVLPTTYNACLQVLDLCARMGLHIFGMIENQSGARSFDGKRVMVEGENREFYPLGLSDPMVDGDKVMSMKEIAERSGVGYLGGIPLVEGMFRQVLRGDPRIPAHSNEAIKNAAARISEEYEISKGGVK